ncbi:hypothetical protein [Pseudomonas versuta]|nr:hypothetical protein [Pseudomonas versuta]
MKTPEFQLIDGITPDIGAYIEVSIPHAWLTDEAFKSPGDFEADFFIDVHDLIQKRIDEGECEFSRPCTSEVKSTIAMLRKYADLLENSFVLASDTVAKSIDGERAQVNGGWTDEE